MTMRLRAPLEIRECRGQRLLTRVVSIALMAYQAERSMSEHSQASQIAFLQGAWRALLDQRAEPFQKVALADYISRDVINRLPDYTTLENVVAVCQAQDAFQESYIKSFMSIQKRWKRMTPETRHSIVVSMRDCGLRDANSTRLLQPLEDDEAALTIQWDVADKLCLRVQKSAFRICKELGLELEQPRGIPAGKAYKVLVEKSEAALGALLDERVKIDSTAVTLAVGYFTPVAKSRLQSRLTEAYLDLSDSFRGALMHWLCHNAAAFSHLPTFANVRSADDLTAPQRSLLGEYVGRSLDSFCRKYEELHSLVEAMPRDQPVYDEVRLFFDRGKTSTAH